MGQTQIVMAILVGLGILGGIASLATIYYGVDSSTSGIKENSPKASQNAKDIQKHANHLSIAEDKKANSVNNRLPLNTEDSTSGYIQTDFPRGSFYILDDYLNDTLSESYALEDESNNKVKITYIKERRIEFALEGLYWDDVRRWEIGPKIYPQQVKGANGELIDTKFANGYDLIRNQLLPIPDGEISLNPKLIQNKGY